MRKFFFLAVFFLGIVIVIISFSELQNIIETLKRHDLRFFWVAVALQLIWILNDAQEYRSLYHLMGVNEKFKQFMLLASAATFVNVVAPSGGWGGMTVFIDNARKRGHPRGHAAAATALYLFLDYAAFLGLLGLGIVALVRRNRFNTGEITASILMVLTVIGLGALIYIGSRSGEKLGNILASLSHKFNRIFWPLIRRDYFQEERARLFAMEVAEGLSIIHDRNERLLLPAAHALVSKALMITIMALIFIEFHVDWSIGSLIASYSLAYLFLVMSPTPSGIGIVEGILPLALAGLGIPLGEAIVVTLFYRAVTFWLPLLLGGISIRLLERQE